MRIGIDMGHTLSGEGTGSQGCGYKEQNLTRELGKIVIEMLKKEGHTIYDCTVDKSSNNAQQLIDRVNKANKQPLDLFVSIHFNACVNDVKGDGRTTGTEVLLHSMSSKAKPYAERIVKKIANVGLKNRGVKTHNAYVLKHTKAPALLIETCFIDDRDDMNVYLKSPKKVAKAIVEGILDKTITDVVETPKNGFYRVLVGSYKDKNNAIKRQEELKSKGIEASLIYFQE
ncbi:MAG: N-acetylmuramoyl-L-alanine amidase [Clostridia bacterium]|jgi:N-acetylmuramoyl-L-alanine amidase